MSEFTTVCPDLGALDPSKRVRYSLGLVLGVDELVQEQIYFLEKDRRHQRGLHGYGTACGLGVAVETEESGATRIVVGPGLAVDARGRQICVPVDQCARVEEWLERHRQDPELLALLSGPAAESPPESPAESPPQSPPGSPPEATADGSLELFLVLCYRECETDRVPIPGGPCRSQDEATTPSRLADSFELRLAYEAPEQVEEAAVRRFGELVRSLEVSDGPGPYLELETLLERVRSLAPEPVLSPPESSPPGSSPPEGLALSRETAAPFFREALRVWVTEILPRLHADGACACSSNDDSCVLLGRLSLPLEPAGETFQLTGPIELDESERPVLLTSRALQELHWPAVDEGGGVGPGISLHGDLSGLDLDDHAQYLLVDPADRSLVADLPAGQNRIVDLSAGQGNGEAVVFEQAIKVGDTASGDLGGTYPDPQVTRLQGRPVQNQAPSNGQVLTWVQNRWRPAAIPQGPRGPSVAEEGLARIVALSWVHGSRFEIPRFTLDGQTRGVFGFAVAFGFEGIANPARVLVRNGSLDTNTFLVFEERLGLTPRRISTLRVPPIRIVPLDNLVFQRATGRLTGATTSRDPMAPGALFLMGDEDIETMPSAGRVIVRILGEFVRAEDGRAIDAEHRLGQLATGDRPAGSRVGVQGGTFESWIPIFRQVEIGGVDINVAGVDELSRLPNIGPALAERILAERRRGSFETIEDLVRVPGISDNILAGLRRLRGGQP